MSIEHVNPDPLSGDPGDEHHLVPAPAPAGGPEGLVKRLSPVQATALQALAAGQNLRQAAKSCGVARSTIHYWLKYDATFRAAYNAWKQEMLESARARLLKGADAAVSAVLQAVAKGDSRAALAILKGIGALTPEQPGLTDPAMVAREMELDRRQERVALADRSHGIAREEYKYLCDLYRRAEREEQRELERQRSRQADGETDELEDDASEDDAYDEEESQEEDEQDDGQEDGDEGGDEPDDEGTEDDTTDDGASEEDASGEEEDENEDDGSQDDEPEDEAGEEESLEADESGWT